METFSPLWNEIVDSSIWMEPYHVRVLFTTMLALKDADHVVRGSAFKLSSRAHMPEQDVLDALKVLLAPDTRRISPQEFDGRRIERVDGGWLVLNGQKYRDKIRVVMRREYKRRHEAERREKGKIPKGKLLAGKVDKQTGEETPGEGSVMRGIDDGRIDPETLGPVAPGKACPEPGQAVFAAKDLLGSVDVTTERVHEPPPTVPEPISQPAGPPAAPRVPVVREESWAVNMERVNAAKKAAGIPVAEAPVERPARRTVLDPGQPVRPKA